MFRLPARCPIGGVLLVLAAAAAPVSAAAPIAHYPLHSDGLDATGLNGAMTLTNAPFQNGGVYCNGIYPSYDPVYGCDVTSPTLTLLNFDSFAASAEFQISGYPTADVSPRPILTCGTSYRYLGAEIWSDGKLGFLYNNGSRDHTTRAVSLDTWHQVVVTYDALSHTGGLYLDSQYVTSASFDLVHGVDRNVTALNPATGRAFLGWIRDIVVYDSAFDPTPVESATWSGVKALFR